jgi:hypothetical protein
MNAERYDASWPFPVSIVPNALLGGTTLTEGAFDPVVGAGALPARNTYVTGFGLGHGRVPGSDRGPGGIGTRRFITLRGTP